MDQKKFTKELDGLFQSGRANEVPAFFELKKKEAFEESDRKGVAIILNEEIGYYRQISDYDKGIASAEEAISIMKELNQDDTLPYAMTLLNYANLLRAAGKLSQSEEMFDRTFEVLNGIPELDRMRLAEYYNNAALLYEEQGKYEKAESALSEALKICEEEGGTRFQVAVTHANLGLDQIKLKKYGIAEYHLRTADDLFNAKGLNDSHHAAALYGLGDIYASEKKYTEALMFYKAAMDMIESFVGRNKDYDRVEESYRYILSEYENNEAESVNAVQQDKSFKKGLEIAKEFYEEYGKEMLHEKFPEYEARIAVGKAGAGSECFGFDDELSLDHDYVPGFSMWLTDEDFEKIGSELSAAYEEILKSFMNRHGFKASDVFNDNAKNRNGVRRIKDFYMEHTGTEYGPETIGDYLYLLTDENETGAAAAVNGTVFRDDLGVFTMARMRLEDYYPERLMLMKLSEYVTKLGQAAQYNYKRCSKRNDVSAMLIIRDKAIRYAMKIIYMLNRSFVPHDKWLREGLKNMPYLSELGYVIDEIAVTDVRNISENSGYLEILCGDILSFIKKRGIVYGDSTFLPDYAKEFAKRAMLYEKDEDELSEYIAKLEFKTFDKVKNKGGRAYCQNDWPTFRVMRKSQYMNWTKEMLIQYITDFEGALAEGRNMITEKYGYMMEFTRPEEFVEIKDRLPRVSPKKRSIVDELAKIHVEWTEDFGERYPELIKHARTIHSSEDIPRSTSSETYLKGELYTYSDTMLMMYGRFIISAYKTGINLTEKTVENTVKMYGYKSLSEASLAEKGK